MTAAEATSLVGHDEAKRRLEQAYRSGRMHHAWLLTGPEGIGKASLAFLAAHMVLSSGANDFSRFNPDHPAARLIAAHAHPDLFVLGRPVDEKTGAIKDAIPVEEARKLGPFLRLTSSQGSGRRVAIIDEAHLMGRNAQNAILKLIEEPPAGAVIFMTATSAGNLLPTIRSRCSVLPLLPLTRPQMEAVLMRLGANLPAGEADRLFSIAGGSVGCALRILETEALPLLGELLALVRGLPALDVGKLHKLGDIVGKKAEAETFRLIAGFLTNILRDSVRAAAAGKEDPAGLAGLWAEGRLAKGLEVWEKTSRTFASADSANLDNKLALITAMIDLRNALA